MVKTFVTFSDSHLKMTTPAQRTDSNWMEQVLGQIEAVFAVASARRARAVLCAGDVGDSPAWSDRAILGLWDILYRYQHIPFYTTVGQHDVRGHRVADWRDSSLGLLSTIGKVGTGSLVNVLEGGRFVTIDGCVDVFGFGFQQPETHQLLEGTFPFPVNERKRIALVHACVGDTETMGWQGISKQKIVGCHVAVFGDVHQGFEHTFPSGLMAYNSGSLSRGSKADIGRMCLCGVLQVGDEAVDLEFVEIPDVDDAVAFHTGDEVACTEDTARRFKDMVRLARDHQDESPMDRVRRIGEAHGFTKRQIAMVVERLEQDQ